MLSPKHQRYAERLRGLIDAGEGLFKDEKRTQHSVFIANPVAIESWHIKVANILETVFGEKGTHYRQYNEHTARPNDRNKSHTIKQILGLLTGALDDLENGFLQGQEFIIAAEVFDSVLEQAKHLNRAGYKDPAAVLGRVVLEDALKRLGREEGIDDTQRAAKINDDLRSKGRYLQPQWRRLQSLLDIGNAAAHGKFEEFSQDDVANMIDDIERFLVAHFTT